MYNEANLIKGSFVIVYCSDFPVIFSWIHWKQGKEQALEAVDFKLDFKTIILSGELHLLVDFGFQQIHHFSLD
jgi:hypothetical protein